LSRNNFWSSDNFPVFDFTSMAKNLFLQIPIMSETPFIPALIARVLLFCVIKKIPEFCLNAKHYAVNSTTAKLHFEFAFLLLV